MRNIFNQSLTLYTKISDTEYEKRIVDLVLINDLQNSNTEKSRAFVYIPMHKNRRLKYVEQEQFTKENKNTFCVALGQKAVIGASSDALPPKGCYSVYEIQKRFLGSRRMHHIKLILKCEPEEETKAENEDEGTDS